tara:strand:- start:2791 stop:3039 length:249 start_codon:yes stop_codon:yes gene_type:complete
MDTILSRLDNIEKLMEPEYRGCTTDSYQELVKQFLALKAGQTLKELWPRTYGWRMIDQEKFEKLKLEIIALENALKNALETN